MVTQIEQMLVEAWGKFCDYYDTKVPRYQDSWWRPEKLDRAGALESHWICWNEKDLTFHIGRFFYDILKEKKESLFSNIEIHFEKKVNHINFPDDYVFANRLDELRARLGMNEGPEVDMIVAYDNRPYRLLLCAEAKCFRYSTDWEKAINEDIKKLRAYRDCKIAQKVVFILFDDYYWCHDKKTASNIQERLDEIRNEEIRNENGITVLFHTSEAKLENY